MLALFFTLASALAAPKASSELVDGTGKHPAAMAFDGLLTEGWGEGAAGYGEQQWLELDLGRVTDIQTLSIWPGNLREGAKSYREYSRPKVITVLVDNAPMGDPIRLDDKIGRVDIPLTAKARKIRLVMDEVYEGIVFSDLFIAEVAIDFPDRAPLGKLDAWLNSKDAEKARDKWKEAVEADYDAYKSAQIGDDAAFGRLTSAVSDGAPYLRERARTLAPEGYRAQAVTSDDLAQLALRKLKDPNAIPAFELAMLRATAEEKAKLQDVVEIFYAYQELIGGGNRNVPYWGTSGWEPGALRGFGEPLNLVADREGKVYVADTGNNRVQLYADNGRPLGQWGPKADLTDAWFNSGRKWYVSGALPGEGAGEFVSPLDIEVIPEKDGDLFAVLDALGRVQIFDAEGKVRISWQVATQNQPRPGLGGQAYLTWVKQKQRLYVIMEDEAVGYTLDANEVSRWKIRDGVPKAVATAANGKILMAFGYELIGYDPDGFRYGTVTPKGTLGQNYEDLDLAYDEKGKLWVITDLGWVYKMKRPNKAEFSVQAITKPIRHPRLIVHDGILHVTANDQVMEVDALQAKLDAESAEKDKGKGKGDDADALLPELE